MRILPLALEDNVFNVLQIREFIVDRLVEQGATEHVGALQGSQKFFEVVPRVIAPHKAGAKLF